MTSGELAKRLSALKPFSRPIIKENTNGKSYKLYEYIKLANINIELDYKSFNDHLYAIILRRSLLNVCLSELGGYCENNIITDIDDFKEKMEFSGRIVYPEFIINVEYGIFAIKSILDIIAQIVYEFDSSTFGGMKGMITIGSIMNHLKNNLQLSITDAFFKHILEEGDIWIYRLSKIRNKMTHHTIARFPEKISHSNITKKITYNRYILSVDLDANDKAEEVLPDYLIFLRDRLDRLLDKFYEWLCKFEFVGDNK